MIVILLCVLVVLLIALWFSVMALWQETEEGLAAKTLKRGDVVRHWNKTLRLGRRSWYNSLRYSRLAASWGNRKAALVFVTVFPKSKAAFINQDPLTGLEHGPSSYFLAHLTRKSKKTRAPRIKKFDLPEQEKSDIVA